MSEPDDPLPEGTLISHLLELRSRLLRAFIAVLIAFLPCAYYSNQIFDFLSTPLVAKLPPGQKLIATTVTATFTAPLKLALVAGLLIAMPYVLYQIWAFVAPGLYRREKRFAVPLLVSAILLFYLGVAFSYFLVFPLVFRFFVATTPHNVMLMADISNYLQFALTLFVAFGVAFETPVAVVLLVLTNLVLAGEAALDARLRADHRVHHRGHPDAARRDVADRDGGADVPAVRGRHPVCRHSQPQQRRGRRR